jgi:polyisoprenoid-binding protein YceI
MRISPISSLLAACALALAFGISASASAQAHTFSVREGGGSRIRFTSDAPLETIRGTSSVVTGSFSLDPNDLSSARGTLQVPVASLRTGVDLRDEHLRGDDWLDAERHPNGTFEITRMEGASRLEANRSVRLRIHGRFTIHGVTRNVVANARVRLVPGGSPRIEAQASFTIQLTDYGVSVPLPVRLKVSNEIQIEVTLRASASNG